MQPGDLVKLVNSRERLSLGIGVAVSWNVFGRGEHAPTSFPEGTAAVFLGCLGEARCGNPYILIEGRVGWVWEEELEAL